MGMSVTKTSITTEGATRLIETAEAAAQKLGVPMVIAIVDESGVLKAFSRMDGAQLLSVEIAIDKAYTAAGFSMPTQAWFELIKNDPPLLHGIGVSGGHYSQDAQVAREALVALGLPTE
jgi:uncharacterized protein GlcG (DUF336 family)